MKLEHDKILHYNLSFKFGRYGSIFGATIILIAGAVKEVLWDGLLGNGTPDWGDMKANCSGAWDGMAFKQNKTK